MTRVTLNGTVKGLRGKIGNLIFRQLPDGTTVMSQAQAKKNSREKKRARQEGLILVDASDDVRVTGVRVTVLDAESRVLETGEAVPDEDDWWEFASQAEGTTVIVEARDLPANVTRLALEL